MINITNFKNDISMYGGSEVKKTYYINNLKYMVKFPDPIRQKDKKISYINNQYSEYIGCKIFELFNIDVQKVDLVECDVEGKKKIAIACQDFLNEGETLVEFKNLSYSLNPNKKYTSDIDDIFEMISLVNNFKDKQNFKIMFYKIFVIDTLLGNVDRHLGNWGLILKDNSYRLSPVYDCGSCLHPLLSITEMKNLIDDKTELKNISINLKTAYKYKEKPVTYIDLYNIMPEELKRALMEIYQLIDMKKIKEIIDNIDELSDIQKKFYYETINYRKINIIDKYYELIKNEK